MFQWSPISDTIARIREEKDAFTQGKNITLNTERTQIFTEYYSSHMNEDPLLKRAGAIYEWASRREINVFDDDIFVGSPGPRKRMISTSVEWGVGWIPAVVDEATFKEAWQSGGNVYMSDEQREVLIRAYDFWKDNHIGRKLEGALTDDIWDAFGNGACIAAGIPGAEDGAERRLVGCISQGHFIGNFDKVVNVGFGSVRRQALE
ncbi:MAG: hypothetical protein LBC26_04855, partial [Oscillospiraceae bacterium]|nr:hypothetical protein [Oscillospiraceae bacterium]